MENVKLDELSTEQRAQLYEELRLKDIAEQERVKNEREAYKKLVSETVNECFPSLMLLSDKLAKNKKLIYEQFQQALVMKSDLFNVKNDQRSHSFTNAEGTERIILGQYETDDYDDTVNEGIAKVKAFIGSLAKDSESKMLVGAIIKLLSRDQKGNLKASRVMQLRKMADESGNAEFMDGVKIIDAAYRPAVSKYYVRAEYKNEQGAWVNVPLGMTEA
jgi:hypothetical protein